MSNKTPNSSGKKLVQARLPFQVYKKSPSEKEPPRKKLAYSGDPINREDNENKDINALPVVVCLSDTDETPKKKIKAEIVDLDQDVQLELKIKGTERKHKRDEEDPDIVVKKAKLMTPEDKQKTAEVISTAKCTISTYFPVIGNVDKEETDADILPLELVEVGYSDGSQESEKISEAVSNEEVVDCPPENPEPKCNDIVVIEEKPPCTASDNVQEEPQVDVASDTPSKKAKPKTAKQLEKEKEMARKKEEREKEKERLRLEKEAKKQKQKDERELQRKKEIELKEEVKKKAKDLKEMKRQQELERREEERKRREEEKEEERKRKEEEALAAKNKFAKEAKVFTTFFKKVETGGRSSDGVPEVTEKTDFFIPFTVKNGMRLAPLNRNPMTPERRSTLDEHLSKQSLHETYLTELRCGDITPGRSGNTWPLDQIFQDDEVEEIPLSLSQPGQPPKVRGPRPKLLQFKENRRPPYWGTWRKKCPQITSRRPFGQYKEFEYDVDSDDEWEEEEPGESLHGSDDEKEKDEDGDDYEVDNDFFVPHGYLSEDEVEDEHWSVEQQKEKLKLLGEQFDQERSEKTKQLRPVVIGCVWASDAASKENLKMMAVLERCRSILGCDIEAYPIGVGTGGDDLEVADADESSPPSVAAKRIPFPDEAIPALLPRIHGATVRRKAIAKDFSTFWAQENPNSPLLTLACISRKVKELAQWVECPDPPLNGRFCWFVSAEVREKYGCPDLPLLVKEAKEVTPSVAASDNVEGPSTPKITKFTKVMTEEERRKSLISAKPSPIPSADEIVILENSTPSPIVEKAISKLFRFRAPSSTPIRSPQTGQQSPLIIKRRVALLSSEPLKGPVAKTQELSTKPSSDSQSTICLSSDTDDTQSVSSQEDIVAVSDAEVMEVDNSSQTSEAQKKEVESSELVGKLSSEVS